MSSSSRNQIETQTQMTQAAGGDEARRRSGRYARHLRVAGGAIAAVLAMAAGARGQVAPAPTTAPTTAPATQPAAAAAAAPLPGVPVAGQPIVIDDLGPEGRVRLIVGRSVVLKTRGKIKNVSFSQPDIAADNPLDPNTILLSARKAGTTQLIIWDERDNSRVVDVVVDVDLNALTEQLKRTFPESNIEVSAANGTILLRGRVPNLQVAEQAAELVGAYGKVLNFLELAGGQQVLLKVRFAEVSRSASNQLGFNAFASDGRFQFGYNKGPGGNPIGGVAGGAAGTTINPAVSLFAGGRVGSTALEGFVQAMRTNNLLRVLAEPNLTAISGKEASFLAGGEFPIPVPQTGGSGGTAITVEYKQFGVRLTFLPVVLGDGRIRLQVSPEVSDLDFSRSVSFQGFTIPSLTKRNVTTTIELNEGQTFAVAGLLNNRVTSSQDAIPLLGDLPILGGLFRSVRYERNESELVVLVTPELVEAMNPGQVPNLPGEHWVFPNENDMFFSQYLGGPAADPVTPATRPGPAKFHGPYGFTPAGK